MENSSLASSEIGKSPGIHTVDINGQRLRYEVSGQGKPLLLLHGWGCSLETVRSIAAVASATHQVFNIDFPGFGESPEPADVWGVEQYTGLIESFVTKMGLIRPVLIGHSFGGRVSILMASRNDVDKVVLVDAAGVRPRRSFRKWLKIYSFKTAKALVRLTMPRAKAEAYIERMRNRRGSADYRNASPKMKTILSKVVGEDLTSHMPSIKAPTLLIWGANDTATPVRDARIMESLIAGSGLVVFEGAGHYSFLDNPRGFAAVLRSFLNSA